MSFGTFSTSLQGVYSWGVLRTAKFAGMVMDIDRIGATLVDKDNKQSNLLAFTQQQGPRQSLNENLVPEMFFNDPDSTKKNVEGVSASKILKLANDQGQKIYQIDKSNINTILPQLSHESQVITDIRNAVAAGKVVTTSEKSINFHGWTGSGYIITDPNTGSGAYMISGGMDGSWLMGFGLGSGIIGITGLLGTSLIVPLTTVGLLLAMLAILLIMVAVITLFIGLTLALYHGDFSWQCFAVGLSAGLVGGALFGIAGVSVGAGILGLFSLVFGLTREGWGH
ncbi:MULTISPECIES: hypothetical protein [unclassified Acinetobacter]|uniref:hypothetical protein n=1 Tax=unclassified Acinetobacter TaxID=196816 RepID=UPI00244C2697|nr:MULTISPECIES: hypothetical protein [unclassified Acinetobacter]MDH0032166.1 hypothetical protein [Acinetobacter sp. GD04021]MDH0886059.1 hypothetical protein [Acinetobacter sp. GD03873]MDH1082679.1 hypothetical protein [Acinetobacter sp. GD03983]MDH2189526.1 hypothetical protein [Acinetobacter sp. GD03645]MDH2203643.1 hypothetical protein [Acinetobacter sp. GD03647]